MILGCIADDFTGAGDVASTLAREGVRTSLIPTIEAVADADCDAGVVALKTRSIDPAEAVSQSLRALEALLRKGCRQILFKYCSTFDSTPVGNIGPVAQALAEALGARGVVVCPAYPANARTVYQGHLFVADRPLSETGMREHPLCPMTDSDIRRWLRLQTRAGVGHVPHFIVAQGAAAIRQSLTGPELFYVVDAIAEEDLRAIGAAASEARLITGGSGIALGLPDNFRAMGLIGKAVMTPVRASGPAIILSGSCSETTRRQVEIYRGHRPAFEIDVGRMMSGEDILEDANDFATQHQAAAPLIFSSATPEAVAAVAATHGSLGAASRVEQLLADLAVRAVARGACRIVVAGGETSGAVVGALNVGPLTVGAEIAPGVPALAAGALVLALKSGNFGPPEFFDEAVTALGDEHA